MTKVQLVIIPEHRKCHLVESSEPERALQVKQDSLGLSGPSEATGPRPEMSHQEQMFGVRHLVSAVHSNYVDLTMSDETF